MCVSGRAKENPETQNDVSLFSTLSPSYVKHVSHRPSLNLVRHKKPRISLSLVELIAQIHCISSSLRTISPVLGLAFFSGAPLCHFSTSFILQKLKKAATALTYIQISIQCTTAYSINVCATSSGGVLQLNS